MMDFTRALWGGKPLEGGVVVIPLAEYMATSRDWDSLVEQNEFLQVKVRRLEAELDRMGEVDGDSYNDL